MLLTARLSPDILSWADALRLARFPVERRIPRLHITIPNKVTAEATKTLRERLQPTIGHRRFRFGGFDLFAFDDGLRRPLGSYLCPR